MIHIYKQQMYQLCARVSVANVNGIIFFREQVLRILPKDEAQLFLIKSLENMHEYQVVHQPQLKSSNPRV